MRKIYDLSMDCVVKDNFFFVCAARYKEKVHISRCFSQRREKSLLLFDMAAVVFIVCE